MVHNEYVPLCNAHLYTTTSTSNHSFLASPTIWLRYSRFVLRLDDESWSGTPLRRNLIRSDFTISFCTNKFTTLILANKTVAKRSLCFCRSNTGSHATIQSKLMTVTMSEKSMRWNLATNDGWMRFAQGKNAASKIGLVNADQIIQILDFKKLMLVTISWTTCPFLSLGFQGIFQVTKTRKLQWRSEYRPFKYQKHLNTKLLEVKIFK